MTMTTVVTDPDCPVAVYVDELAHALHGPGRARRSMLAEAHDSLHDAVTAYRDGGSSPETAAGLAIGEFGPVAEIAPLYQAELTARQGRSTAVLLAVAFPGLMIGWELLWSNGQAWNGPPRSSLTALSWAEDVASASVGILAVVLVAATFRRGNDPRRVTVATAVIGAFGAFVCAGSAVAMNVVHGVAGTRFTGGEPTLPVAYVVSALALTLVVRSVMRSLRSIRAVHAETGPA